MKISWWVVAVIMMVLVKMIMMLVVEMTAIVERRTFPSIERTKALDWKDKSA